MLHQLGSCTDEMRQQFLDWHHEHFVRDLSPYQVTASRILSSIFSDVIQQISLCFQSTRDGESVAVFVTRINSNVLVRITRVYATYKNLFLSGSGGNDKAESRRSVANRDDAFMSFVKDTFELYLSACERQFCRSYQEFVRARCNVFTIDLRRIAHV